MSDQNTVNWIIKPEAVYTENPDADIQQLLGAVFGTATAGAAIGKAIDHSNNLQPAPDKTIPEQGNGEGANGAIGNGSTANSAAVAEAVGKGLVGIIAGLLGVPGFIANWGLNAISAHSAAVAAGQIAQVNQEAFTTAEHAAAAVSTGDDASPDNGFGFGLGEGNGDGDGGMGESPGSSSGESY